MAIRNIRKIGDDILRKKSRKVEVIDDRILQLLDDMAQTLSDVNGVGLAAPQVGVLKRVVVIDVGDGVLELINPEIINVSEETVQAAEACLSIPGKCGEVIRPAKVVVRAMDRNGDYYDITGQDLLARAFCHEIDHLDGNLFVDRVIKYIDVEED